MWSWYISKYTNFGTVSTNLKTVWRSDSPHQGYNLANAHAHWYKLTWKRYSAIYLHRCLNLDKILVIGQETKTRTESDRQTVYRFVLAVPKLVYFDIYHDHKHYHVWNHIFYGHYFAEKITISAVVMLVVMIYIKIY